MEQHYREMSKEQWKRAFAQFQEIAIAFIESNGYSGDDIIVSPMDVYQILTKVDQRKEYFHFFHELEISELKEVALYCFWIIKFKPLRCAKNKMTEEEEIHFEYLNEKFALFNLIKTLRVLIGDDNVKNKKPNDFFSPYYIYELVYSFAYRDISKEAMILLVETIAMALELNPSRD